MVLYEHSLYKFELINEGSILVFQWKSSTESMTEEDFKEALHNFTGFGFEYGVKAMLLDVRNFRFQMTGELSSWRESEISPRYTKIGVTKFAYLFPIGVLDSMPAMAEIDRTFEEKLFENEIEATKWLEDN